MEEFYKKYYFGLRKFVSQKIDDEGLVDEIVNDVMFAGINTKDTYGKKCSEFSWLCSIAKHKVIDYYRKKKIKTVLFSVSPMFEEIADKALTPERDVLKNELKDEIKKTFKEIKEGYKKLLRLKYIDGFKVNEIAKKTNLSVKAVESRLVRAKKQFREAWVYDKKKD
jgi:RNA polymerase sigma-70 factor (ECF subfamily)